MSSKRRVYLIFAFRHAGTGSELPPEDLSALLKEPAEKLLALLGRQYNASSNVADYRFLDWELRPVASRSTIAAIPNPGVVFAVEAATAEDALHRGTISKQSTMNSSSLLQFIRTGHGLYEPKTLIGTFWRKLMGK